MYAFIRAFKRKMNAVFQKGMQVYIYSFLSLQYESLLVSAKNKLYKNRQNAEHQQTYRVISSVEYIETT